MKMLAASLLVFSALVTYAFAVPTSRLTPLSDQLTPYVRDGEPPGFNDFGPFTGFYCSHCVVTTQTNPAIRGTYHNTTNCVDDLLLQIGHSIKWDWQAGTDTYVYTAPGIGGLQGYADFFCLADGQQKLKHTHACTPIQGAPYSVDVDCSGAQVKCRPTNEYCSLPGPDDGSNGSGSSGS